MRQVTLNLAEEDIARVNALRIPRREGEDIPNLSAVLRLAVSLGLDALELQRKGSAAPPSAPTT
jgi:hypothetical protein